MSGDERCPICHAALGVPGIAAPDRLYGTPGEHLVAVCPECGAGVTLPRVGDDELADFYPAEYGPYDDRMNSVARLASRVIRAYQGWRELRTPPLGELRTRPTGRALDVGCGRGDLAVLLAQHGWTMTGIEPSPDACAVVAGRGIDVRRGTLSTVALELETYDAVIFRHSLEHTNDPVAALRAIFAALAPGGVVLITVPNFGGWQARRFTDRWFHLDLPRHRLHFTPGSLDRALTEAGLDVVSLSTSASAAGLPASIQYAVVGRCLFPDGLGLRVAVGLCALTLPLTLVLDRLLGGGDLLHAVAMRPA